MKENPSEPKVPAATIVWTPQEFPRGTKLITGPGAVGFEDCTHDLVAEAAVVVGGGVYVLCSRGCGGLGQIVGEFQVVA